MTRSKASVRVILGIDPGTLKLGWGVVELRGTAVHHVAHGVVRPPARQARSERLGVLATAIGELLAAHRPAILAVETAFLRHDPRAALALGEARGVAIGLGAAAGVQIVELSPSATKRAVVGTGRASKGQMQEMVRLTLALPEAPPEDAADALAAAITAARADALPQVAEAARVGLPRQALPQVKMTEARAIYAAAVAAARAPRGRKR